MKINKIPVTVITGFLGSGKTTLINNILKGDHGIRFAIIENEFGELGIDQDLVIREKEEIIEMNNGCICCTVRGDLIRIILDLVKRENPPEHILIETTGLADPSPVAQTFLTNEDVEKYCQLDGIVTLVDAKHFLSQLENTPEAKDQIAFADKIILNKLDLVNENEKKIIVEKIQSINRFAKIVETVKSSVAPKELFGLGGFDIMRAIEVNPKFMEIEYPFEYAGIYNLPAGDYKICLSPNGEEKSIKIVFGIADENTDKYLQDVANPLSIVFSRKGNITKPIKNISLGQDVQLLEVESENQEYNFHIGNAGYFALFTEHMPEEFNLQIISHEGNLIKPEIIKEFRAGHTHDEDVNSVGIEVEGSLDEEKFIFYINSVVRTFGNELYRFKGILSIKGVPQKVVLQGVHMLFDMTVGSTWDKKEKRVCKIIFIGRNLDRNLLTQGFLSCKN